MKLTYEQVAELARKHQIDIQNFDYTDSNALVDMVNAIISERFTVDGDALTAHVTWLHQSLRENGRCVDGGKCHHGCKPNEECFRKNSCVPLSGSRLTDNWELPKMAENVETAREKACHALLERAYNALACAALTQIPNGEKLWREIGEYLKSRA